MATRAAAIIIRNPPQEVGPGRQIRREVYSGWLIGIRANVLCSGGKDPSSDVAARGIPHIKRSDFRLLPRGQFS